MAREVVRIVNDGNLIEKGRETAAFLLSGLEKIQQRTGRINQIRARGLMVAIELGSNDDASTTALVHKGLAGRGYLLVHRPGTNVLRLDPSLTIEHKDIEGFLAALEDVLKAGSRFTLASRQ